MRRILLGILGSVLVGGLAYGGAFFYVQGKRTAAGTLRTRVATAAAASREAAPRLAEARAEARRLKAIRSLLDAHVSWSRFFGFLERMTHPDVAFSQFATEGLDGVLFLAEARSYGAIAEQVQALSRSPMIREVQLSGISAELAPTGQLLGVKLTLKVRFDPALLKPEEAGTGTP